MKKRFKSKKNNRFKVLIFIIILFISFLFFYKKINKSPEFIRNNLNIIDKITNNNYLNFNSEDFLIKYSMGDNYVYEEVDSNVGDYLEDPEPKLNTKEPIVYIYNTHQGETYNKNNLETYNISPTVMLSSYMLREELNSKGIPTIVETNNIKDILNKHNWIYKDSYKASRILLDNAYKEYPSLKVFIDLHRDSSVYKNTTYQDDNKSYAKILFVVGLDYHGYEDNLNNAIKLNDIIKRTNSYISRGIYKKTGKGVNGIYNQNFKNNTFLIEVGGQYNNIEEVKNTIKILADCIDIYIKENIYEKEI